MKFVRIGIVAPLLLSGCMGVPRGVTAVTGFELERYLGKWYEIARLDHPFERGLEQVTAEYSLRQDGRVRVLNRGYDPKRQEWKQAEGKADFARNPEEGYLKVSFFGPFYASYIVFGLDRDEYSYAFVCGSSDSYLWLLARTPQVNDEVNARFLRQAEALGFDTSGLIYVRQR